MIRFLVPALCLLTLSSLRAEDDTDRHIPPPSVPDPGSRPKMDIHISEKGETRLDGVVFSEQQLAVVFDRMHSLEPEIALRIRTDRATNFRQVKSVIEVAKQAGIIEVVLLAAGEPKPGEQGGAGQPATRSESK